MKPRRKYVKRPSEFVVAVKLDLDTDGEPEMRQSGSSVTIYRKASILE